MKIFSISRALMNAPTLTFLAFISALPLTVSQVFAESKTLTIQGVDGLNGETIVLDSEANAEVGIAVNETGVVITLPVKVQVKCYGDETATGYCLLAASDGLASPPAQDPDDDPPADDPPANDPPADDPPADDPPADDPQPPPATGYCSGDTVGTVCSASRNLDNIYTDAKDFRPSIGKGRIESYPFTLDSVSSYQNGSFDFVTSNSPFSGDVFFRVWISSVPGGAAINDTGCDAYKAQARGAFEWAQGSTFGSQFRCDLPAGGGVFYANLAIVSCNAITTASCEGSSGQYSGFNDTYLFDFGTKP